MSFPFTSTIHYVWSQNKHTMAILSMSSHRKSRSEFPGECSESSQGWALLCCMGFSGMCKTWEKSLQTRSLLSLVNSESKNNYECNHFTLWEKKSLSHTHLPQMHSSGLNMLSELSLISPWRGEVKLRSLGCRSWGKITPALRNYSPTILQSCLGFTSKHSNNVWAPVTRCVFSNW